jgi:hypothetical protein
MAIISKGITLSYGETVLTNLMEIPELGGESESLEITVLSDAAHMYTNGILNYGDSLAFKFLYEDAQFTTLAGLKDSQDWTVSLPDGTTCSFGGTCSVKLDGVGVNAVLTYTLSIKPDSEMLWA